MPIFQPYYLNAADLASSTAVFLDPLMTVCAPDGFYSDGLIVREMVGCVLQDASSCVDCGLSCVESTELAGAEGVYLLNVNLGSSTGAVIVTFTPNDTPDGIKAEFDSVVYNALSSPLDGYHAAPTNLATYVGNTAFDCGLVAGSPYVLTEYENNGLIFSPTGNTPTVTVTTPQVSLSAANPMGCIMVIPKPSPTPTGLAISMYGICAGSTYNVSVSCPERLRSFYSTAEGGPSGGTCIIDTNQIYYSAPVNGDGVTLGLYDWIFTDYNGQNTLPDGVYTAAIHCPAPYDSYEVQNGVITQFYNICSSFTMNYEVLDSTTPCVTGGIASANLLIEWMPLATIIVNTNANSSGSASVYSGVYKITLTVSYTDPFTGCGAIQMKITLDGFPVVVSPNISPTAGSTYAISHTFSANNGAAPYTILAEVIDGTPL